MALLLIFIFILILIEYEKEFFTNRNFFLLDATD